MTPLLLFILLGLLILVLFEWRARRKPAQSRQEEKAEKEARERQNIEGECCGEHLVCEKETLLQTNGEIVYYDDEELDRLSGLSIDEMDEQAQEEVREVFHTLKEEDVIGWCRSMQLRNITLPEDVREEALMIVREKRKK